MHSRYRMAHATRERLRVEVSLSCIYNISKQYVLYMCFLCAKHVFCWCCYITVQGFCNGCITKRILLLQAFHSLENQYYADYDKTYYLYLFNLLS